MPGSYGPSKVKDMGESILPSTRRKGARYDRAKAHRQLRHEVRQRLGRLRYDDYDDYEPSVTHNNNRRIHEIKWERREGDKIAPLQRWAEAITRNVPVGERVEFIRRLMPDTLAGRHALTHLGHLDEEYDYRAYRAERDRQEMSEIERWNAAVHRLLGIGAHAEINIAVKRALTPGHWSYVPAWMNSGRREYVRNEKDCCHAARTLAGVHDVDAFMRDLRRSDHPELYRAVQDLAAELLGETSRRGRYCPDCRSAARTEMHAVHLCPATGKMAGFRA